MVLFVSTSDVYWVGNMALKITTLFRWQIRGWQGQLRSNDSIGCLRLVVLLWNAIANQ
jgi:hypothetical protein